MHNPPYGRSNQNGMYINGIWVDGRQVLEYLNKKGYSKTEATLRREVADRDGGPVARKVQDKGWERYVESYGTVLADLTLVHFL